MVKKLNTFDKYLEKDKVSTIDEKGGSAKHGFFNWRWMEGDLLVASYLCTIIQKIIGRKSED